MWYYIGVLKLLPVILILLVISGGLIYFRISSKSNVVSPQAPQVSETPLEVPKTLPNASMEDRVKSLESVAADLVKQVNNLKSQPSQNSSADSRLKEVEGAVTELKLRVSTLEKGTSPQTSSTASKPPLYIPLGSGGTANSNSYTTIPTYEITIDPGQYAGYTSMRLEVNMRLNQPNGTAYARLINAADSSAASAEVSTTSSLFTWISGTFTPSSGSKTYRLQLKSSENVDIFIQNARIKVNF